LFVRPVKIKLFLKSYINDSGLFLSTSTSLLPALSSNNNFFSSSKIGDSKPALSKIRSVDEVNILCLCT
jgi:hypothetical protein